jgi:O-antigen/teichoic acid export membrane protein
MIVLNAAAQLTALAAVILIQMAYSIAVARVLGVDDFGRFSFVFSLSQILLIGCDLGLHNTAVRKIAFRLAQPRGQDDAKNTFTTFFSLKLIVSIVFFAVAGVFSVLLRDTAETRLALLLFSAGVFFQSLNAALNMTFQAHGKLYLGSLNNVVMPLLNLAFAAALMLMGGRLVALGLAYLAAMALAFALNWIVFHRRIHPLHLGGPDVNAQWREFAWESLPVGVGTLFNTIAARIDVTLLALLAGNYATGIYSAAYRIYGSLLNIPIAIFSAVLPAMASFGNERQGVRALFNRSILSMLAIGVPLAVGLFGGARILVGVLFGAKYAPSTDILAILAWSLIPAFAGMAFSHVILSQGTLVRRLPVIAAVGMIANIGLNLVLIPRMGNRGAAWATLGTESILAALYAIGAGSFLKSAKSP